MSSIGNPVSGPVKTYIPDAAITQGCAVAFSGSAVGHVAQVGAANAPAIGVADFPGTAGVALRVTRSGDAMATAGAAILAGQYVKTDAQGRFVPVTGTPGGGENIIGRAESPAVAAGDTFVLFVLPSVL